ncbi:MAG: hypothetical protein KatS3mg052_0793 [Candidatus Roseilinea sp.]|nr:MAG: hypothetical protein KatS3mg052_0793 [Candidatus Roseilinea sp.]
MKVYRLLPTLFILASALSACSGAASPAPTATLASPTATPMPPTATPVPPSATPVPPTATPVPPTATAVPEPTQPGPGVGEIADFKVTQDGDFLLISFAFGGTPDDYNAYHIFIDADQSAQTGFQVGESGAEFLFENAGIFSYSGDGKSWSWNEAQAPELEFEPGSNTVSWKILRATLGLEKAKAADFTAQLVNKNWDAVGTTPKLTVEFK